MGLACPSSTTFVLSFFLPASPFYLPSSIATFNPIMSKYTGPINSYTQAVADQSRLWIPIAIMNQALQNLSNVSPATQAGRQTIIDTVATLIPAVPYSISDGAVFNLDLRFGTNTNAGTPVTATIFVAAFRDGWSEVITQLQSAADFSQRIMEKGINSSAPPADMPDANNARSQYNDAVYSVRKAVQTARTLVSNCTGLYNYHTFESKYQLSWGAGSEPLPPPPGGEIPPRALSQPVDLDRLFSAVQSLPPQNRAPLLMPHIQYIFACGRIGEVADMLEPSKSC